MDDFIAKTDSFGKFWLFSLEISMVKAKLYIPSTLNIDLMYTVAHTIDCVCSKMLNNGLNHGLIL